MVEPEPVQPVNIGARTASPRTASARSSSSMAMGRGEEAVAVGNLGADLDQSGHFDAKDNARSPGTYYTHSRHLEKNAPPRLGENLVAIKTEVGRG